MRRRRRQQQRVVGTFLLMIAFLASFSVAVLVNEDTPLDTQIPQPDTNFCVSLSAEESICYSDPIKVRRKVDPPGVVAEESSLGVKQRIDGTESEKKAIREVLKLMNMYWHEEVLSNHDYEGVRTTW